MKHTYIYIVLFLLLLVGCEHDQSLFDGDLVPVQIVPSLNDAQAAGTRVIDVTWQTTDVVGVSIDGTNYKTYKPSAAGTSATLTPTATAQTLYYPVDGSSVTFRAFCPNATITSNEVTYSTFATQSTSAAMQAVDLVYHKGATGSKSSPTVNMTFAHQFSKVVINVTKDASISDALTSLAMTMTGMPRTAKFNVSTGVLGALSSTGAITPFHENSSTTGKATAIVPPHVGTTYTGRTVTFKVGSLNYSYSIPNTFTFEAGKSYTFNFTLTQTAPILTSTKITSWNVGTIAWDGAGYSLTAPAEMTYYKNATTGNTIVAKTNHTATPVVRYSTSATTVTGSLSWLTQASFTRTKTTSPYEWTLTYSVAANNTGADRVGYIHITVGEMTVVTAVTQKGTSYPATHVYGDANCFIVTPGTAIKFSLSRPISQGKANTSSTFTITKLWDDTSGGAVSDVWVEGTGSNAMVTVVAGNNPGNALVAAKVGANIVWSYHIWVTDYNPYAATFANNGLTFMDRNLGATTVGMPASDLSTTSNTTGLFYQWGRKDPFPATGASGATQPGGGSFTASPAYVDASTGTVDYAIKNPNVFLKADVTSDGDWHFGSTGSGVANRNQELWGHTSGLKTVYDPCPAGWRVPRFTSGTGEISDATSPWKGFTTTTPSPGTWTDKRGRNFGTNAYYQASGTRSRETGALGSVGTTGYYWSASPNSSTANSVGHLHINSSGVNPANNITRAFGYSVRCVQE